ncbi:histone deacetylase complex subunit SAP30L-like [Sycon ciliatum]|uniref:histone deacetylase complex subunit SAP30L-like n=1 Tax=Sycon ciliatum TaxID=27933 RepID=UPI0020AB5A5D
MAANKERGWNDQATNKEIIPTRMQNPRHKRKRKESDDEGDFPEVDLSQLQVNTLRRYKRHFKLQVRPGLNKAQLVEVVSRHFSSIPVSSEREILAYFIFMAKSHKSKLDHQKVDL